MAQMNDRNNPRGFVANGQQAQAQPQSPQAKPPAPPVPVEAKPGAPVELTPVLELEPGDDPTKPIEMQQWSMIRRPQGMMADQFTVGSRAPNDGARGIVGIVQRITVLPSGIVRIKVENGTIIAIGGYGLVKGAKTA